MKKTLLFVGGLVVLLVAMQMYLIASRNIGRYQFIKPADSANVIVMDTATGGGWVRTTWGRIHFNKKLEWVERIPYKTAEEKAEKEVADNNAVEQFLKEMDSRHKNNRD